MLKSSCATFEWSLDLSITYQLVGLFFWKELLPASPRASETGVVKGVNATNVVCTWTGLSVAKGWEWKRLNSTAVVGLERPSEHTIETAIKNMLKTDYYRQRQLRLFENEVWRLFVKLSIWLPDTHRWYDTTSKQADIERRWMRIIRVQRSTCMSWSRFKSIMKVHF